MTQTADDNENELERPITFGRFIITQKENAAFGQYDRLAHVNGVVKLVSVVAEPARIKAMRAMMAPRGSSGTSASMKAAGLGGTTRQPSQNDCYRREPGYLDGDHAGYTCEFHRLEYGYSHAVFISKDPNFLIHATPDSLWAALRSDRFTTPLIKAWMPYVTAQLIINELLIECECHRLNSSLIKLKDSKPLDTIITDGIRSGVLRLE